MAISDLFSDEKVNTGRQVELDIAKAFAIIFMVFLHTIMVVKAYSPGLSSAYEFVFGNVLGRPYAAVIFMFCMGVGVVYSRHSQWDTMVKRGVTLYLLGILVNVFEFFVPHFLAESLGIDPTPFTIDGGLLLFCVDILAFAGMAFILIGILRKLKVSAKGMVLIALMLSIAGSLLRFHDFGSNIPNLIAGYFIGSAGGFTAFPLFNWFIFPAAGLLFGEYYIRCNDKKKLLRAWPAALVIATAYFVISWYIPNGFLSEIHHYYFMTTFDALFCIICNYGVIGFCCFVSGFLSDGPVRFIAKMSGNLNPIYIVQWYLIPLTYIFIVYFNRDIVFGDLSLVIIALLEIVAATAIAAAYKNIKKKSRK